MNATGYFRPARSPLGYRHADLVFPFDAAEPASVMRAWELASNAAGEVGERVVAWNPPATFGPWANAPRVDAPPAAPVERETSRRQSLFGEPLAEVRSRLRGMRGTS